MKKGCVYADVLYRLATGLNIPCRGPMEDRQRSDVYGKTTPVKLVKTSTSRLVKLPNILHRPNVPLPSPNNKVYRTKQYHRQENNNRPIHSRHRQQRRRHTGEESYHKHQTQPPQRSYIHAKTKHATHVESRRQERLAGEFAPDDDRDANDVGYCEGAGAEGCHDVESGCAAEIDECDDDGEAAYD